MDSESERQQDQKDSDSPPGATTEIANRTNPLNSDQPKGATPQAKQSKRDQRQTIYWLGHSLLEWLAFAADALIAITALVGLYLVFQQLAAMRVQSGVMIQQMKDAKADGIQQQLNAVATLELMAKQAQASTDAAQAMKDAADAMKRAAKADEAIAIAARDSASIATRSVKLEYRAEVAAQTFLVDEIALGKTLRVEVVLVNKGRAAATNLHGFMRFKLMPIPEQPRTDYAESDSRPQRARLLPNETLRFFAAAETPLADDGYNAFKAGKSRLFIYGTIWYGDVTAGQYGRYTNYCMFKEITHRPNEVAPCERYNDTDDDHPGVPWKPIQ